MQRDWPWPAAQLDYFGRKAKRAMAGHERAGPLTRSLLIWLALCGWGGEPVRDLFAWSRDMPLGQLRAHIAWFDSPDLRWIEDMLGWPDHSSGFGDRSR